MITASQDFITAVGGNGRHFDTKIYLDGSEVLCDIISMAAVKGAQDGSAFTLGSVFSSSLVITCSGLSVTLENEDLEVKIGILTDREEDTYSYITYGKYTVIKAQKTKYQTVLTCVGFISSKLNAMLPDVGNTPTLAQIASAVQTATGVAVTFAPSVTTSITLIGPMGDISCRAALSAIAFAAGGFATENNTGGIVVYPFTVPQSRYPLSAENCLAPPIVSEEAFEMTGIKVIQNKEGYILTTDTTVDEDKTYYVRTGSGTSADPYVYTEVEEPTGNPSAQGWYEVGEIEYHTSTTVRQTYENKYISQAAFNYLASVVVGIEFVPSEIDMSLGDPRLEPWDCLTVTDVDGETTHTVPCHLIESTFDGGFSSQIYSIGESLSDTEVTGSVTEQIKQAISDLTATQAAADQAKAAADAAAQAASGAQQSAETAQQSANQAIQDAQTAQQSAESAQQSADDAQSSAVSANASANSALNQLSEVEKVLDVLNWASEHGEYALTADTAVEAGKYYFEPIAPTAEEAYSALLDESDVELANEDSEIIFAFEAYMYAVVFPSSDENPQEMGWYELAGIDEALSNYVSSHLALTESGLWLQTDGVDSKLLLSASDGLVLYGSLGQPLAKYGESAIIGDETGFHIEISDQEIGFYQVQQKIAYINGNRLYITQSVVLDQMDIGEKVAYGGKGQWSWCVHEINGRNNLYLKWLG